MVKINTRLIKFTPFLLTTSLFGCNICYNGVCHDPSVKVEIKGNTINTATATPTSTPTPTPTRNSRSVNDYRSEAISILSKKNPNANVEVPTGIYAPITYVRFSSQLSVNDTVTSGAFSSNSHVVAFVDKEDVTRPLTISILLELIKSENVPGEVVHLVMQSGQMQGDEPNTDLMAFKKDIINATVSGSLRISPN
jgi:hypothetical protein